MNNSVTSTDVTFDAATAHWGNLRLVEFTPADELHIKGLQNRYRQRGIGPPLAANGTEPFKEIGFEVAPEVKVPVMALLRIDVSRQSLAEGHLHGIIDVYLAFDQALSRSAASRCRWKSTPALPLQPQRPGDLAERVRRIFERRLFRQEPFSDQWPRALPAGPDSSRVHPRHGVQLGRLG